MITLVLPSNRMLIGRDSGEDTRKILDLDKLDLSKEPNICIMLSHKTLALSNSFFVGCFLDSIRTLGKHKFEEKYRFIDNDSYFEKSVDEGICRCVQILGRKGEKKCIKRRITQIFSCITTRTQH